VIVLLAVSGSILPHAGAIAVEANWIVIVLQYM
jgi:hypothetical protein